MDRIDFKIIEYEPIHQRWFEKLNRAWIEPYFGMESIDEQVLRFPDEHIIAHGGTILMATQNDEIAGTVALKFVAPGVFEFTKMAVDQQFRGKQIGKSLALSAIKKAKSLGAEKIILYSNTILQPAISLYKKIGFVEVPLDGPYKRSNIKMELNLNNSLQISIRRAMADDARLLTMLGIKTFYDTFAAVNTKDDMNLYLSKTFHEAKLQEELEDGKNTFFVAEDNGLPAGYAKIRRGESPTELKGHRSMEIERLYAVKEYIGKQIGQKLMASCLQAAIDDRFEVVWLGVWEHNHRAIAFYEKCGFKKFSSHPFMLGNDLQTDLLMQKIIDNYDETDSL